MQLNRMAVALWVRSLAIATLAMTGAAVAGNPDGPVVTPEYDTRLVVGPYNAVVDDAQLTLAQQNMLQSLSAELGHIDSTGDIPWPQSPDAGFNPPLAAVTAWINLRIPNPQFYTGHICFDWEGPRYLALFDPSHPNHAVIESEFIAVVEHARSMCPQALIGFFDVPQIPTFEDGLQFIAPHAQAVSNLISHCTALYPSFYFNEEDPRAGLTDAQYIEAAWDILLNTELCQGKPVYFFTWPRRSHDLPPPTGLKLLSETQWQAVARAAVGTDRVHSLAGIWMWHPDEYFHGLSLVAYTSNTISANGPGDTFYCAANGFDPGIWHSTKWIRTSGFALNGNNGVFPIVPKSVTPAKIELAPSQRVPWLETEAAGSPATFRLEPHYTAFQNESPYLGGAYPWEQYREIRGQRLLTILHNALRDAHVPLPEFACSADVNGDHVVNVDDLLVVITLWGQTPPTIAAADIDGDGTVSVGDMFEVITSWGPCG